MDPKEWAGDKDFICAVISATDRLKLNKPLCYRTEFDLKLSRNTRNSYTKKAIQYALEWISAGQIPASAMRCMLTHFPRVISSIPFFSQQASKLSQNSSSPPNSSPTAPSNTANLAPNLNSNSTSDSTSHLEVTTNSHPLGDNLDLIEPDSEMWEDIPGSEEQPKSLREMLGPEVLRLMYATNRQPLSSIPFVRLLQHWFITSKIPQEHITTLLKMIKKYRATLTESDIDCLPTSARTLLKLTVDDLEQVQTTQVKNEQGKTIGTYMHYGVEPGVLGISPGLLQKVKHKELMRRVHLVYPTILPPRVVECLTPDISEVTGLDGTFSKPVDWCLSHNAAESIIFNIHVSSDGVTPYKTESSSIRCIMGSIDSLISPQLGLKIPIPDSPPFIIGVYKGQEKNSDVVLQPVVDELLHLSPKSSNNDRVVYCQATAWIADAVERNAVCGTLGTAGIASCPRCEQEGLKGVTDWQKQHSKKPESAIHNHVYFPKFDAPLRTNEEWNSYLWCIGNEPSAFRKRQHVQIERIFPGQMVNAVPLDSMHTIAGGTCKDFINRVREIKTRQGGCISRVGKQIMEARIVQMRQTVILEPARYIRSLELFKEFKMREVHVFFSYYLYPVAFYACGHMNKGALLMSAIRCKLLALHLTKGMSPRPIPSRDLEKAQAYFRRYCELCMQIFGPQWATPKNHWLTHILDDCKRHSCHLERLAAWKFENEYASVRNNLRNGDHTLLQLKKRFCEKKKFTMSLDEDGEGLTDFNLSPMALAAMRHFDTIELPPSFVHSLQAAPRSKGVKFLKCEAFRLYNTFPNNIALLTEKRVMFCIDFKEVKVDEDISTFYVEGFLFAQVQAAFHEPQSSAQIGFFKASNLACNDIVSESAVNLVSKCFIFPRGPDMQLRPNPETNPLPDVLRPLVKSYAIENEDEGHKEALRSDIFSQALSVRNTVDYWWVQSIAIPGRFPNHGQ